MNFESYTKKDSQGKDVFYHKASQEFKREYFLKMQGQGFEKVYFNLANGQLGFVWRRTQ